MDHKRELRFKTRIFTVKTGKLSGFLKKRITKMGAYIQPKVDPTIVEKIYIY